MANLGDVFTGGIDAEERGTIEDAEVTPGVVELTASDSSELDIAEGGCTFRRRKGRNERQLELLLFCVDLLQLTERRET